MNPLRTFLFFVAILSVTFAFGRSDFTYSPSESFADWGHGCQVYYADFRSTAIDTTLPSPYMTVAPKATSDVTNERWEILTTVNKTRQTWLPNVVCTNTTTANGTVESCTDKGSWKNETYTTEEWQQLGANYKFEAGKKAKLRYCTKYEMIKSPQGWGARIDVVPSFAGYNFPEYAWFNVSWTYERELNDTFVGTAPFYTAYYLLNSTVTNGSNNNCTDIRIVDNAKATAYPSFVEFCHVDLRGYFLGANGNDTLIWANITDGDKNHYLYFGNPGAINISDNSTVFALFKNAEDGTTQGNVSGLFSGTQPNYYNSFLGAYGFYLNDTGTGNARLMWNYPHPNGTTYSTALFWTALNSNLQALDICGVSKTSSITACGNDVNGYVLRVENVSGTMNYKHTYSNGVSFVYPTANKTMIAGTMEYLEIKYFPTRLNSIFVNETEAGTNLTAYSAVNVSQVMVSAGYSAGTIDRAAFDNLKVYATTNETRTYTFGSVSLGNENPEVVSLNLTPTTAYTETDLTAAFTINDTDSEYINATVYWYKNGIMQPSLNATFTNMLANSSNSTLLGNGNTTQNELWSFAVNSTDGTGSSSLNFSSNVTILNREPAVSGLTITMPSPYHLVAITCNFTALDNDSDTMTANVTWYNGSTVVSTQAFAGITNGTVTTATLAAGNTTGIGDVWKCGVNLSDSYNTTSLNSSTVTVANNVPEIQGLALSPATPYNGDPLNCSFTAYDADGDLTTAVFRWYRNGTINNSLNSTQTTIASGSYVSALLADGNTSIGDNWSCNVSLTDSFAIVSNMTANVTIINHQPQISGASFLPVLAYDTDNLTCSFTAFDDDADLMNVTFRFYVNGTINNSLNQTYIGLTNNTVQSAVIYHGNTTTGETWGCNISLTDGYDTDSENTSTINVTTASVTLIYPIALPIPGVTLYGAPVLTYAVVTPEPVTCNLTTWGVSPVLQDVRSVPASSIQEVPVTLDAGTYAWYVNCTFDSNPALYIYSGSWWFNIVLPSASYSLNLSSTPENILSSPQALYYDVDDYINALYFQDGVTDNIRIFTVNGSAVLDNYTAALNATKQFFVVLREPAGESWILTFNTAGTHKNWVKFSPGNPATVSTTTTSYGNTTDNANADPYTYADTKHFDTLNLDTSSYYLVLFGTTNKTKLGRINASSEDIISVENTTNNRTVAWQTHAITDDLKNWYYAFPRYVSGTYDYISIYKYNGSASTLNATPGSSYYTKAQIEGAKVYFESYNNKTYFVQANTSTHAVIYLIEEAKTYQINYTVSNPSHFFFIDEYTFVFFSNDSGTTYAYSCYFANSPNCTRMTAAQYGASVPYMRGQMITSHRDDTSDVITQGAIYSTNTSVSLAYDEYIYDAKFMCYDEMDEVRYPFTMQIFETNASQLLTSSVWGYVLPSDMLGDGTKRAYGLCTGGTTRLRIVGLNNAFALNLYSLNTTDGQYYDFHVTDQYSQPVSNVTIAAMRFSPGYSSYVTIEQGITDFTGTATLFLEPYILYQFTVSADGYVPMAFEFVPATTTSITIVLDLSSGTYVNLPTFSKVFDDISYSITPDNISFAPPNINISYQIASTNATLEYYGIRITRKYNGTLTTVLNQNITTQPAGGLLNYTTNGTGQYTVTTWFKAENYSLFQPTPRIFYIGNATGLAAARQELIDEEPISGWTYYLIAVVAAMLVAGFVSRYTVEGAGIVGLCVLWGFTWLYPSAFVVEELGITTFYATCLTTVMVGAGVYIMRQGV